MNRPVLIAGSVGFALLVGATSIVLAETLLATSTTAMAITGDVEMDDFSMVFADGTRLDFDELVGDSFVVDGETVNASVYSVAAPMDPVLLNGNRLCGSGPVTYVASWGSDSDVAVAVFDTQDIPGSDADMCALYYYTYPN
ncbi:MULTISPECIES: hypothetical protein [Aurantimonas]|uniref:hypothetical protein n=1 Tax=Aurantimonas TaxID=182269 RepID=UPI0003F7DACC|nr:hypothetical protein [Aurantimonas coralicida]